MLVAMMSKSSLMFLMSTLKLFKFKAEENVFLRMLEMKWKIEWK